jgi:hypothetical protein
MCQVHSPRGRHGADLRASGPVGSFRRWEGHFPPTFEPEFAGLEGQCFVPAKLQARPRMRRGTLNPSRGGPEATPLLERRGECPGD